MSPLPLEFSRSFIFNEIRHLLLEVVGSSDKVFVREKLYEITVSIISRMTIGKNAKDSLPRFCWNLKQFAFSPSRGNRPFRDLLEWMDLQGMSRRTKPVSQNLRTLFGELISKRRKERQKRDRETADADFLDVLLTTSSFETEVPITDLHITGILRHSLVCSVCVVLLHTFYRNSTHSEFVSFFNPETLPGLIEKLFLSCAVMMFTMMIITRLPLLLPHAATQQCQVNGYDISSGTQVYVNVWAIGRDPNVRENPLKFYPERFFDSKMDVHGHHWWQSGAEGTQSRY
ncbi:hypothetical protein KP509_16G057700 [Ceratopteris richardii]|uniref:Cytochrome P450 n=1 Tax=Ceratopteris richardii TaxID=49495 RepID=A0A8T2T0L9_CERRI|nr:hypothetical protein KP509_16G057700 [Ceratopteris richardii]